LSDDPLQLYALGAVLGRDAVDKYMLLDTASLEHPNYHRFLRQRYGDRWPKLTLGKDRVTFLQRENSQAFLEVEKKTELVYLHPSWGDYFETFYLEPRHLVYTLKPYPPNTTDAPVPTAAMIATQSADWNALEIALLKNLKGAIAAMPEEARRTEQGPGRIASYY